MLRSAFPLKDHTLLPSGRTQSTTKVVVFGLFFTLLYQGCVWKHVCSKGVDTTTTNTWPSPRPQNVCSSVPYAADTAEFHSGRLALRGSTAREVRQGAVVEEQVLQYFKLHMQQMRAARQPPTGWLGNGQLRGSGLSAPPCEPSAPPPSAHWPPTGCRNRVAQYI